MNSLENNIKTMGMLSKIAYNKEVDDNGNHIDYYSKGVIIKVNNEKYKVIDYADTISGLQALLLKNETTNSYVIAFRGTQGVMDVLTDISPLEIL